MPTKAEKELYAKLARLGCILCRQNGIETTDTPTEIHHVRRYGGKRNLAPAFPYAPTIIVLEIPVITRLGLKISLLIGGFHQRNSLRKLGIY